MNKSDLMLHINALRKAILRCLLVFLAAVLTCYLCADWFINILSTPLLHSKFGIKFTTYTSLTDGFMAHMNVATSFGLFTTIPYIACEIYKFCAVGMYKNEKQLAKFIFSAVFVLFAMGNALAYYWIIPGSVDFFLSYGSGFGGQIMQSYFQLKLLDYIDLVMDIMLVCGLILQIPVVIFILHIAKIIDAGKLGKYRRYWIVGAFIIGAVITPPDVSSQIIVASVMILLIEISILACKLFRKN